MSYHVFHITLLSLIENNIVTHQSLFNMYKLLIWEYLEKISQSEPWCGIGDYTEGKLTRLLHQETMIGGRKSILLDTNVLARVSFVSQSAKWLILPHIKGQRESRRHRGECLVHWPPLSMPLYLRIKNIYIVVIEVSELASSSVDRLNSMWVWILEADKNIRIIYPSQEINISPIIQFETTG